MIKICKGCNKEFDDTSLLHNRNFCNDTCKTRYWNKKYNDKQKAKRDKERKKEPLYCIICGKELDGGKKKYCSVACHREFIAQQKGFKTIKTPIKCPICGKEFLRTRTGQKYCSVECSNKSILEKQRKFTHFYKEKGRKCIICGKELNNYNKLYCSRACRFKDKEFEPNRCMVCGGIIPDKQSGATLQNYVICESCVSKTKIKVDPNRIYHGKAKLEE